MNSLLTAMLRRPLVTRVKQKKVAVVEKKALDSVDNTLDDADKVQPGVVDVPAMALDAAADYTKHDIKLKALAMIQQWVETDDLDAGESSADRLLAMMVGIADSNKDGEITDDEQEVLNIALECAHDYFDKYQVSSDDSSALLNDWDADAAERVRDLLAATMPNGDDADEEINSMVFDAVKETDIDKPGEEETDEEEKQEEQGKTLDAAYKKKIVVRNGKKVRINKRIAGKVRLSAKQKVAIRKAQMKSHRGAAMMKRKKSNRVRKSMGLK